tara:strand:- start:1810 stop:2367 length:558 start_codon:yes stop_codon:yes gene_type:complete
MKKCLLFVILISCSLISFSQNWTYKDAGNAFDGKYKTSFIKGSGEEFPYNTPMLCINKFESQDRVNFYIGNAGFFNSDYSKANVYLSFNNEPNIIYESKNHNYSNDGSMIFLWDFTYQSDNKIYTVKKTEIIKKLMTAEYLDVRVSTQNGKNDLRFSLKGSTKAINFVISEVLWDRLKDLDNIRR